MKSLLVIGMGHFGTLLAEKLLTHGNDVMIIDKNEQVIEQLAPHFTNAQIGDCTNADVLKSLEVENFDACFVTIDENFQASLEITSLLKELGAKCVVSKANRDIQAKFLLKNGADSVVYPEKDIADKLATKYSANNIFDYIQLTADYSIFELPVLRDWVGKSIESINVRRNYNIIILAIKVENAVMPMPSPAYVFNAKDHIIVMGEKNIVLKLVNNIK